MPTRCSVTAHSTAHSPSSTNSHIHPMNNTILDIKKDLRAAMNGVASAAMRSTADYRVNFGVELPRLQSMAQEYGKNHELAQSLWKESVRECRILATMIQPAEQFDSDFADLWMDSIHTLEIAQIAALHLFQHINCAADKAFQWIASDDEIRQVTGLSILCHLLRRTSLNPRCINELTDQLHALTDDDNTPMSVRRLATNLLQGQLSHDA